MPKIVFIEPDGVRREIDAPAGITLMEAARHARYTARALISKISHNVFST